MTYVEPYLPYPAPSYDGVDIRWLTIRDWKSAWVDRIFDEFTRCARAPGWNPKMVHLEGDLFMVDTCSIGQLDILDIPGSIKVFRYVDHPILSALPRAAPRAVRSIYRKENRLKYLRATDAAIVSEDYDRAKVAWVKYLQATGAAVAPDDYGLAKAAWGDLLGQGRAPAKL